ncbi:MAG: hypothetical protein ISR84_01120 [Kiritimatiellales bacterium]|nr:hypothetical protein [Kiritimatiellales bacterium]
MKSVTIAVCAALALILLSGCAMIPGGVAPSNTPINGRDYTELGYAKETDSRIYLLGLLPISGSNTIRDAIEEAIDSKHGDALINITVETYGQYWILWSRVATRVEGNVIRFY